MADPAVQLGKGGMRSMTSEVSLYAVGFFGGRDHWEDPRLIKCCIS